MFLSYALFSERICKIASLNIVFSPKGTEHSIADIRVIINEISLNFRTNQDDYFRQPLTIQREHRNFSILHCSSSACKARYCGELVDKRHKGAADFQKPLSCTHIRNIAHLRSEMLRSLASSSLSVDAWFNIMINSEFASIVLAVWLCNRSSTF